ncbi:hypothetical protein GEMRC1_003565 [Eukaryota sp. GEM-RC1]
MSGRHAAKQEDKTVAFGRYKIGQILGEGTFGHVKLAEHALTGHKVAVKILSKRKIRSLRMDEKVKREIRILKLFDHPHITKLYEVIDGWGEIYMILEFVPGGELFDLISRNGPFKENDVRHYFQQIISAVDYCHRNLIVHRDLKPENILLDAESNIKIADFGLSNLMADGNFLLTSCGSPNYAAPEVISGQPYVGPAVDVWSIGVILYAMLFGRLPFDDRNIQVLFTKIKSGRFFFPSNITVPDSLKDLIRGMLIVDPLQRASIDDIKSHEWFRTSLPKYLDIILVDFRTLGAVDEDIVDEVEALFSHAASREEIKKALRRHETNEITVAYHLIRDQRWKRFTYAENQEDQSTYDENGTENMDFGIPIPTFALEARAMDTETDDKSDKTVPFSVSHQHDFSKNLKDHDRKALDPSMFDSDATDSNRDPLDIPVSFDGQPPPASKLVDSSSSSDESLSKMTKAEIAKINSGDLEENERSVVE